MFSKLINYFQKEQRTILSAAILIMVSYGLSMLLGVVRERLLVTYYFECCREELDVYYAAFRLPDTLFQLLVTGSLTAAFIPVFSRLLEKSKKDAFEASSVVLNGLIAGFLFLGIPIFIFAPQLSELITGSFSAEQVALMTQLTRWMLGAQFFFLFSSFMTGMIQSHHRFLLPALSPILYNLAIIGGIAWLWDDLGIYAPVVGVVIGSFLHAILQVPLVWKLGFRYRWSWNFRIGAVREIGKLIVPRTLSSGINQLEATAAVYLATSLTSGSLVIFSLAQMLMLLPIRLVGVPISQAAFPQLSKSAEKDEQGFVNLIADSFLQVLYFVFPITAILLILRIPIVRLAYGAAGFPWQATLLTGRTLALFVLAIPAQAVIQLLVRSFYARKDTRTPLFAGLIGLLLFLLLSVWFTFGLEWGVLGLAGATSLSSFLQLLLLLGMLNREVRVVTQSLVIPTIKLLFVTLLTATFLWVPMRLLDQLVFDTTRVLPLIGLTVTATAIGLVMYFLLCEWIGVREQRYVLELLQKLPAMRKSIAKLRTLTNLASAQATGLGDGKV